MTSGTFTYTGRWTEIIVRDAERRIKAINKALGTKPPKQYQERVEELQRNKQTVIDTIISQPHLRDLIYKAVLEGGDILKDENLQASMGAHLFSKVNLSTQASDAYEAAVKDLLGEHFPGMIAIWSKPVKQAWEDIQKAREELPNTLSFRDTEGVNKLTPKQFEYWSNAHRGINIIESVLAQIPALYGVHGRIPNPDRRLLTIAPATLEQLRAYGKTRHEQDVVGQYRLRVEDVPGLEVDLASPDALRERLANVAQELQEEQEAEQKRRHEERKKYRDQLQVQMVPASRSAEVRAAQAGL